MHGLMHAYTDLVCDMNSADHMRSSKKHSLTTFNPQPAKCPTPVMQVAEDACEQLPHIMRIIRQPDVLNEAYAFCYQSRPWPLCHVPQTTEVRCMELLSTVGLRASKSLEAPAPANIGCLLQHHAGFYVGRV